ncbi:hypothetical protein B0H17DRAFT_1147319 [Mycena rosella]|uniref:Uncharacterized protein n=1 Tax=Mycena rosella TaxID=1033263 RepID=A0AAD7FZX5_MYCRO|nr:hypothetical protein B0H17DRAFT_1147319 [Mycena rosella]
MILILSWVDVAMRIVQITRPAPHTDSNLGAGLGIVDLPPHPHSRSSSSTSATNSLLFMIAQWPDATTIALIGARIIFHQRVSIGRIALPGGSSGKSSSLSPTSPSNPPQRVSACSSETSDEVMPTKENTEEDPPYGTSSQRSDQSGYSSSTWDTPSSIHPSECSPWCRFAGQSAKGFDGEDLERADILAWDAASRARRPPGARSWNPVQNSPPAVDAALSDLQVLLLDQAAELQKKSS